MGLIRVAALIHSLEVNGASSRPSEVRRHRPVVPDALDRSVYAVTSSRHASPVLSMAIMTRAR